MKQQSPVQYGIPQPPKLHLPRPRLLLHVHLKKKKKKMMMMVMMTAELETTTIGRNDPGKRTLTLYCESRSLQFLWRQ
ncbi:hypothetical protein ACJ72_08823 [Emergomyces africanus]|uniref:Uncharacterized protein n=1 Tax=Emergomyces africanus TaxID=1955775 RepID=A0A1B7NJC8_9EURO|nr:hypothetical protein ACJ72_08823 [Emergomyces africanus]